MGFSLSSFISITLSSCDLSQCSGPIWPIIKVGSVGALLICHTVGTIVLNTWWRREREREECDDDDDDSFNELDFQGHKSLLTTVIKDLCVCLCLSASQKRPDCSIVQL